MKIYFEAYGCTLNQGETALYVNKLLNEGNTLVSNPKEADLSIIGTCAVIKKTEDHMMARIQNLSRFGKVEVIGCLAPVKGKTMVEDNVSVIEKDRFRSFQEVIDEVSPVNAEIVSGIPINQGCTGKCNFCVSHIARGKLVSRKPEKIAGQIKILLQRGIKEIKITSLDTAAYGKDIGLRLPHLIRTITEIGDDFRLRVGMMEPKNTLEIVDDLISAYRSEKVFKFLHLPVQSGDDYVLEVMNREYTVSDFIRITGKFREAFPDSTLSTDLIIGYYAENDDSFEKTVQLIEKIRPEIINVTKFSPRELTADFEKRPKPTNILKEQDRMIADMHKEILQEKFSNLIGKTEFVLITENGKGRSMIGRDHAYRPIVIMDKTRKFEFHQVEITGFENTSLIGRIID